MSYIYIYTHTYICVAQLLQLCPTLCDPMDYNLPGFSVHGILQARILEWVAMFPPEDLPKTGIEPVSPALQADPLSTEPRVSPYIYIHPINFLPTFIM